MVAAMEIGYGYNESNATTFKYCRMFLSELYQEQFGKDIDFKNWHKEASTV